MFPLVILARRFEGSLDCHLVWCFVESFTNLLVLSFNVILSYRIFSIVYTKIQKNILSIAKSFTSMFFEISSIALLSCREESNTNIEYHIILFHWNIDTWSKTAQSKNMFIFCFMIISISKIKLYYNY